MIAIVGASGSGKSTAIGNIPDLGIEGLSPASTAIVNVNGKPLPFRGWMAQYKELIIEKNPAGQPVVVQDGNYLPTDNAGKIVYALNHWSKNPDIKNIVVDDFQYIMANIFMAKAMQAGYDKFNLLAKNAFDVLDAGRKGPADKNFIVLTHAELEDDGTYKIKTIGKMLDNKITLEGLFTVVLYADQTFDKGTTKKFFVTNYNGKFPAKSPVGMFEELTILNDLAVVVKKVEQYYQGEVAEVPAQS